jgi:hypothetical protein
VGGLTAAIRNGFPLIDTSVFGAGTLSGAGYVIFCGGLPILSGTI